jgi:hypothetical protein
MPCDDPFPLHPERSLQALLLLRLSLLCGELRTPELLLLGISLLLAHNAHQRVNAAAVLRVSRHRGAGELSTRENGKVVSLPVATTFGTSRAAGGDPAAGMPDVLKAGEIEA